MVYLRSEFLRAPVALPIGLICRGAIFADVDCPYDSHPEGPLRPKRGGCARAPPDRFNHGHRDLRSLHTFRRQHGSAASP